MAFMHVAKSFAVIYYKKNGLMESAFKLFCEIGGAYMHVSGMVVLVFLSFAPTTLKTFELSLI